MLLVIYMKNINQSNHERIILRWVVPRQEIKSYLFSNFKSDIIRRVTNLMPNLDAVYDWLIFRVC